MEIKKKVTLKVQVKELEDYMKALELEDYDEFVATREELVKNLTALRVREYEHIVKHYQANNPSKSEGKKEEFAGKLEFLKGGGEPKDWNFLVWKQTHEATTEIPCSAVDCEFKAKTPAGLATHVTAKHPAPDTISSDVLTSATDNDSNTTE